MPRSSAPHLAGARVARAVGRRWRTLGTIAGVGVLVLVVNAVMLPHGLHEGYLGLVLGVGIMLLTVAVTSLNPPVADARGSSGWSIDALRRVRGWQVLDGVVTETGRTLAHVIVTPRTVLAIELRHDDGVRPGARAEVERLRRDLDAAEQTAQAVRRVLRSEHIIGATLVTPVLIVSGRGAPEVPAGHRVDNGVHIVDGARPEQWVRTFTTTQLDVATRRRLVDSLARHAIPNDDQRIPLRVQVWRELRAGIADDQVARAARRVQEQAARRRHGLRLVPPPLAVVEAPSDPLGTTQAGH